MFTATPPLLLPMMMLLAFSREVSLENDELRGGARDDDDELRGSCAVPAAVDGDEVASSAITAAAQVNRHDSERTETENGLGSTGQVADQRVVVGVVRAVPSQWP